MNLFLKKVLAILVAVVIGVASQTEAFAVKPSSGATHVSIEVAGNKTANLRVDFPGLNRVYELQLNLKYKWATIAKIAITRRDLSSDGHYLRSASGVFRSSSFTLSPGPNQLRVFDGLRVVASRNLTTPATPKPVPKPSPTKSPTPQPTQSEVPDPEPSATIPVDLEAPSFVTNSLVLSPSAIAPGAILVATVRATDDSACCQLAAIWLTNPSGVTVATAAVSGTRISATAMSFRGTLVIPANSTTGAYNLVGSVRDEANNYLEAALLGTITVTAASSGGDTLNPVIDPNSSSVSPVQSEPGNNVSANYRITDDMGCCGYHQAWLYNPAGTAVLQVTPVRVSGSQTDGRYTATFGIPSGSAPGTYQIKAQATDLTGKYTHLQLLGTVTVTVAVSPPTVDTANPVVVVGSGTASVTSLQPGNPITGTYRVTDDMNCCSSSRLYLYDSAGASVVFVATSRVSGTITDGVYSGTINVPLGTNPGTYTLRAQVIDIAGKYSHMETLATVAITAQTAPPTVDTQNPVIDPSSGVLSTTNVTRGQSFTLTYRVTDDIGANSTNGAYLYDSNGQMVASVSGSRISGTALDGTYLATFTLSQNAAAGTYTLKAQTTDQAGKWSHLQLLATFTLP